MVNLTCAQLESQSCPKPAQNSPTSTLPLSFHSGAIPAQTNPSWRDGCTTQQSTHISE